MGEAPIDARRCRRHVSHLNGKTCVMCLRLYSQWASHDYRMELLSSGLLRLFAKNLSCTRWPGEKKTETVHEVTNFVMQSRSAMRNNQYEKTPVSNFGPRTWGYTPGVLYIF